jgi:hypothetical protein
MTACIAVGMAVGMYLASDFSPRIRIGAAIACALIAYLVRIYHFYTGLGLFPMVLPLCPCCRNHRDSFHILDARWPRATLQCGKCNGEFVIWLNGTPDDQETWEKPVLALKWPYAWGIYKRLNTPNPNAAPCHGSTPRTCNSERPEEPSAGDDPG